MDVPLIIRHRLKELGLDQKDLAAAAKVTESYISQLLARKKTPPAPSRTDIYEKMGIFLKLPSGELSRLADLQRQENLKKMVAESPTPLFGQVRELILRKCEASRRKEVRAIFEKEPFGELERLVTQKLLDVAKRIASEESESEEWLRLLAHLSHRSSEQIRVAILEFLNTDVFHVSIENCGSFLDPMIESWDIDLRTFGMEIVLNRRLAVGRPKRFEFVEREPEQYFDVEPGLEEFLRDASLSGNVTEEEIEFLRSLKIRGRRPAPIYYYRELQNLRDPLHFRAPAQIAQARGERVRLIESMTDTRLQRSNGRPSEREVRKIAFVGDHLPRKCGIATFTADLLGAVALAYPQSQCLSVSVNDTLAGYEYPEVVRFEIEEQDLSSYLRAADFLNISNVDIVCLQHEFGIFGGPAGGHILAFLRELRMPVVTTLHTVLQ